MGVHSHDVTIANGATESSALDVEGRSIVAVRVGTVAATTASFKATVAEPASPKGVVATPTFLAVVDSAGDTLSFETPDNSHITFDPAALVSVMQVKIVAGTAASGDETWTIVTRSVD